MEPEHLSPAEVEQIKVHLQAMTDAITAAQASGHPTEAVTFWSEYRGHQAEIERLLPAGDTDIAT
jgi:hypothetical protein